MASHGVKFTFYLIVWSRQRREHVKTGPRQLTLYRRPNPSVIRKALFALSDMISMQECKADLREAQSVSLRSCLAVWLVG